ncbi:MAG: hypothetical protein LUG55_03370 [Clostridiales bacterium]|nr:hypothetical protein [Clostridiales bacterium]
MGKVTAAQVERDLKKRMGDKCLTSPVYRAQLEQYMELYRQKEDLIAAAEEITANGGSRRTQIDCLKEARQLQKSMQSILNWLGIDPAEEQKEDENFDL